MFMYYFVIDLFIILVFLNNFLNIYKVKMIVNKNYLLLVLYKLIII